MTDEMLVRLRKKRRVLHDDERGLRYSYELVNPDGPEAADRITSLEDEKRVLAADNERLRDHIFGHAEFAEYRIKDGIELGATVWRLALEDIAKESRTALSAGVGQND